MGRFYRWLRREHPNKALVGAIGVAVSLPVAVVATGGVVLIAPVITAVMMLGAMGNDQGIRQDIRVDDNEYDLGLYRLVGDPKDVRRVVRVQRLIDSWSSYRSQDSALVPALHEKIMRHISDVIPVLSRLRVYHGISPAEAFPFTRNFIDAEGRKIKQALAVIDLKPIEMVEGPAPVVLNLPVKFVPRQRLSAPETLRIKFNAEGAPPALEAQVRALIAAEVEPLQQRIAELEKEKVLAGKGLSK